MIIDWKTICKSCLPRSLDALLILWIDRFFFLHLLHKPVTELTGQESYVYNRYRDQVFDFLPVSECFRLQELDE